MTKYDIIIIGAGPAGLSAAIYSARYKLKSLLLYDSFGGMIATAPNVENYPGFKSIQGIELTNKMKEQALSLGVDMKQEQVIEIKKGFTVKTTSAEYKTKSIILAMGSERRKLNIKGEKEFAGKGVAYCATCDAPFFKGKDVAVVGGGNAAFVSALLLSKYANHIYLIHRQKDFKAEPLRLKQLKSSRKISIITPAEIKEIKGKEFVSSIVLSTNKELKVQGVFIEIGSIPSAYIPKKLGIKLNKKNEIIVNENQETNIKGVFAAGDMTSHAFKQIATAVGEGAEAAYSAYLYTQK